MKKILRFLDDPGFSLVMVLVCVTLSLVADWEGKKLVAIYFLGFAILYKLDVMKAEVREKGCYIEKVLKK